MRPTARQELAVLRAVTYAALFDYPLTLAQLRESLSEAADEPSIVAWWHTSRLLQATVAYRGGLFFPVDRPELPATRARREALSRDLLVRNRRVLAFVSALPFVRMVAVSGSLAHLNADQSVADLDLFVVTGPNRVWSVTVLVLVVARLLGWRKRLCMNYVVSERTMAIEPSDLFSANQIIHLRPVSGPEVYARFVDANPWVNAHYPNFSSAVLSVAEGRPAWQGLLESVLSLGAAQVAERVARAAYRWHLGRRSAAWQSRDQVRLERECLKLHTSSHRAATLQRYEAAVAAALDAAAASPEPAGGHEVIETPVLAAGRTGDTFH